MTINVEYPEVDIAELDLDLDGADVDYIDAEFTFEDVSAQCACGFCSPCCFAGANDGDDG